MHKKPKDRCGFAALYAYLGIKPLKPLIGTVFQRKRKIVDAVFRFFNKDGIFRDSNDQFRFIKGVQEKITENPPRYYQRTGIRNVPYKLPAAVPQDRRLVLTIVV